MMARFLRSNLQYIVMAVVLALVAAALQFFPGGYWLEVRSVRVFDSKVGEPIVMSVDREIKHGFRGDWTVTIRRVEGDVWCSASGRGNYAVGAKFPAPLTLQWWTYPTCYPVPAGEYRADTCWTIRGLGLIPDKDVCAVSNIFRVEP